MGITTMSSREFNQDTGRAKNAAKDGPVVITDRGRPAHVLLTIEDYEKLTTGRDSIVDLLAMSEDGDVDFEPPRVTGRIAEPADLS